MIADWAVALISAGAAIGGAATSSGTQLMMDKRRRSADRSARGAERKRTLYADLLRLVVSVPTRFREAIHSPSGYVEGEFAELFDDVDARLLLDGGSKVRSDFQDVRAQMTQALEAYGQGIKDGSVLHASDDYQRLFQEHVRDAIEKLASDMATELRLMEEGD